MAERELTDLEKEANDYFNRAFSIQKANGFGYDDYKFIGITRDSKDTAVLRKLKSTEKRTYPLKKLLDFYKEQAVKLQVQKDKAKG